LHTASALSRNLKRPWLKDLELIDNRELSLSNQDKVENYLKPMKNQGFQPFSRILLVEKALSKFWPLG
jgi:hypothetical protein